MLDRLYAHAGAAPERLAEDIFTSAETPDAFLDEVLNR